MNQESPFIAAAKRIPELTVKAFVLGIILTVVLCASNAYLALKVGQTVSGSIPAAIIAMGVLKFFKRSTILENNIVQTTASVGEALTSGIVYTMPALLILHFWTSFNFFTTFVLSTVGGILGVLMMIPIRRILLDHKELRFPEGRAIAEVLKSSEMGSASLKPLLIGGLIGGVINFLQDGLEVLTDGFNYWNTNGHIVYGFGLGFSPAIIAAGYIIGIGVAISTFIGVMLGWIIGIPVLSHFLGVPHVPVSQLGDVIWAQHIRYIGVGTMLVGALWTILILFKPIAQGLKAAFSAIKIAKTEDVPRTEKDISIVHAGILFLILLAFGYLLLFNFLGMNPYFATHLFVREMVSVTAIILIALGLFVFSPVSAYFAGLIGASNSPASGLMISALLIFSVVIMLLLHVCGVTMDASMRNFLAAFLVLTVTLVAASIGIANDSIQDLKSGHLVGATPWKQQLVLILGVIVAASVVSPVLELLFKAYGMGGVFPHPGMPVSQMLPAPQAGLIAALANGIFDHNIPWGMVIIGACIAAFTIVLDRWLKPRGLRISVLAVGMGIYLPLTSSVPIIFGGLISYFVHRNAKKRVGHAHYATDKQTRAGLHRVLLLACGMVAGASLMGVILAVPFAIKANANALAIVGASFRPYSDWISVFVTIGLCVWLYNKSKK